MPEDPDMDLPPLNAAVAKALHDMRTPLSCMRTTVEILRMTQGNAEQQEKSLGLLEAQMREMNEVMNKLAEKIR
ncbi:MAG: hypothetical protein EOP85_19540 [Verrucomicrobiaceae bacterium]|nr:MAG: hypothetical protein EOP85_19540 [Verrucomicrobiaceae bacterium]